MIEINPITGTLVDDVKLNWQLVGEIGYVLVWICLSDDKTFEYKYAKSENKLVFAGDLITVDYIIQNNVCYCDGWSLNYLECSLV